VTCFWLDCPWLCGDKLVIPVQTWATDPTSQHLTSSKEWRNVMMMMMHDDPLPLEKQRGECVAYCVALNGCFSARRDYAKGDPRNQREGQGEGDCAAALPPRSPMI
jgi:hypothetical protein